MLSNPGCAVPKELCYHLQAYSPVQAPGSIGVPGNVGEDGLVYPAEVTDGFQIDIHLVIAQYWQLEVVLFEYLHPLFQDDGSIVDAGLVALVVDVVLTVGCPLDIFWFKLCHIRVGKSRCRLEYEQVPYPVEALVTL